MARAATATWRRPPADPRGFLKAELAQPGIALLGGAALPTTPAAVALFYKDQAERKAEREGAAEQGVSGPMRAAQLAALAAVSPVFARVAAAEGAAPDPVQSRQSRRRGRLRPSR